MTEQDFETRVRLAIMQGTAGSSPAGLVERVHQRARERRRRTALTSAAAALAVAVAVGGAALLGGRDSSTPIVADGPAPAVRVESWRDLQVSVPATWGYGVLDDWCANGGDLGRPRVERPGAASYDILCNPLSGYGVRFGDGSAADPAYGPGQVWQYDASDGEAFYPEGAWVGYQTGSEDNIVTVVSPDRATTEQVLASFERIKGADANGCSARTTDPPPAVAEDVLRLCRYGIDDWLEQSELLTGQDAIEARTALEAAPAKGDRMCTMGLTGPVVMVSSADAEGRVTLDVCHGFTWEGADHDLTTDVLYWMLSPGWSGGWTSGSLPMPEQFRR